MSKTATGKSKLTGVTCLLSQDAAILSDSLNPLGSSLGILGLSECPSTTMTISGLTVTLFLHPRLTDSSNSGNWRSYPAAHPTAAPLHSPRPEQNLWPCWGFVQHPTPVSGVAQDLLRAHQLLVVPFSQLHFGNGTQGGKFTEGKLKHLEGAAEGRGDAHPWEYSQPGTGMLQAEPRSSTTGQHSLFSLERTLFAVFFISDISSSSSSFVSGERGKSKHGCAAETSKICCPAECRDQSYEHFNPLTGRISNP